MLLDEVVAEPFAFSNKGGKQNTMPKFSTDPDACRNERDAIAFLGLLSYMFLHWDASVTTDPSINAVTNTQGLNICGLIPDNQQRGFKVYDPCFFTLLSAKV
jgi:hypothetical protein